MSQLLNEKIRSSNKQQCAKWKSSVIYSTVWYSIPQMYLGGVRNYKDAYFRI